MKIYVSCDRCEEKFENEADLLLHKETCNLFPCGQCAYICFDIQDLNQHIADIHPKNLYQKRRKQHLKDINIDEESEDEYIPGEEDEDEALLIEETDDFSTNKRKRTSKTEVPQDPPHHHTTLCLK